MSKHELEDLLPKPRTEDEVATVKLLLMYESLKQRIEDLERFVEELPDKIQGMLDEALEVAKMRQKLIATNKELAESLRET